MADNIAVLVPVIGRPQRAEPFMTSHRETLQQSWVYAICEEGDPESIEAWEKAGATIITTAGHTFAEKVNEGFRRTTEEWVLLVGDDVKFHKGWQQEALKVAERTGAKVIGTNDLMVPGVERAVHPLINRAYVDEVGAGWDGPSVVAHTYQHWHVDDEIATAARQRGVWAYAPEAVIEHMHFLNGKAERDEVYDRGFATAQVDRAEFEKRFAANQPEPEPPAESAAKRVVVYGIAKNEAKHVSRWAQTALAEADEVVLVDTGSTDGTMDIARDMGVTVHQISVNPWRFDMARNAALALLPADADICVSLDMDEWLQPGWRKAIEDAWQDGTGVAKITLKFVTDESDTPVVTLQYLIDRVLARNGSKWVLPCHEVGVCPGKGQVIAPGAVIHHLPDPTKLRTGRDTPLLKLGMEENPDDPRAVYYYARQLFYNNEWTESRMLFHKYLGMPNALFDQERSEACRFIAKMVWRDNKTRWLLRACYEAPQRRECWYDLMEAYAQDGFIVEAAGAAASARNIKRVDPGNSFHVEPQAWNDARIEEVLNKAAERLADRISEV